MGKIRVKVIGDEQAEKEQQAEAKKRAEAKKIEAYKRENLEKQTGDKTVETIEKPEEIKEAKPKTVKKKFEKDVTKKRSNKFDEVAKLVDKNKTYSLQEAVSLLPKLQRAKFDETVELHINTTDKGVSGNVTLPHGTGKTVRIVIANQSEDPKGVEELVKKVESGTIDFDVLLATPETMPKLARIARFLGPRGLMPNPKNGTVTPKPQEMAKKFEGGQMNFKAEAKFPLLHLSVGKVSFGDKKLGENVKAAIEAVQLQNIKSVTLKSTMSPGMKLDVSNL